jgi:hypothetical protein
MRTFFVFCCILSCVSAEGQGFFFNLNFEFSRTPNSGVPNDSVPITNALPGWSGFIAGSRVSTVLYDDYPLGSPAISLEDSHGNFGAIDGNYSAIVFGETGATGAVSGTISQTGIIPAPTLSLLVKMRIGDTTLPPVVTLGGQSLNMIPLQTLPAYTLYGASISSFAGQVATLSFSAPIPSGAAPSWVVLDDIAFSTIAVPEPSTLGLAMAGSVLLSIMAYRRKRMKAQRWFWSAALVLMSSSFCGHSQGTFGNLDFESANVAPLNPGQGNTVLTSDGMPGWTAYYDGRAGNTIYHNGVSLAGATVAIEGPQFLPILRGQYSAYVVGDYNPSGPAGTNWSAIAQTGLVPQNAKTLYYLAAQNIPEYPPIFEVTLGGVSIPVTQVGSTTQYTIWAGDVSAFAGLTEQLMFTALPNQGGFWTRLRSHLLPFLSRVQPVWYFSGLLCAGD